MNCQDFESNIDGLARDALMDARAREVALAHERACARCSARLAYERALTYGLRALAADTTGRKAPARVETALLAAFRARTASSVAAAETINAPEGVREVEVSRGSVAPLAHETTGKAWSWVRTVAYASLAAAAALALFMLIPPSYVPKSKVVVAGNQAVGSEKSAALNGDTEISASKNEQTSAPYNIGAQPSPQSGNDHDAVRAAGFRRPSNRVVHATNASLGSQAQSEIAETDGNEEVTTEFIPLMQGEHFTQGEGGHLVRVELPRSALERFGLPVNAEQAGGRVKADVLLGEDGLARAIRFVR